jgi:16S rRNA (cytidine1402-2'-O)-methyltransferase
MPGQLFVVATPIGNLEDISLRALTVLQQADLIACEDTRHTRKLLVHFGIETATTSYHEFNEEQKSGQLLNKIIDGLEIALVSDAGTPLLSDPGYRLVKACRESGVKVTPIPGPFAGASAASVSGLPTDKLLFLGFLPKKKGAAVKVLQDFSSLDATIVIYLAPHGIVEMLKTITEVLGDRPAFLAREMTKLFESNYSGTLNEIIRYLKSGEQKGEFTLVIGASTETVEALLEVEPGAYVLGLMGKNNITSKEAIDLAANHLGVSRNKVYQAYLDAKK